MAYKPYNPKDVLSPKRHIKEVDVIFNNSEYAIAKINWSGKPVFGIRWHINDNEWNDGLKKKGTKYCLGEPNSRGYPTWFILPDTFMNTIINTNSDIVRTIKENLK